MTKEPDSMHASEIARRLGVDRSQVTRWKAELGEPVNPGEKRPRWPAERVLALGQAKGYLDAKGQPIERAKAERRRPIPMPHVPEGRDERYFYVPDIAAMFGTTPNTVHAWINRGVLRADARWDDGQYPAWPFSELRRMAKARGVTMDTKAKRAG